MINPQELRLGNWVVYDSRYFKIHSIADIFPTLNTTEFGIGVVDYNNISGIPLTPTILEKCGFAKCNDDDNSYILEIPRSGVIVWEDDGSVGIGNDNDHLLFASDIICKYVHNLQNLIYSLTKKELQIDSII